MTARYSTFRRRRFGAPAEGLRPGAASSSSAPTTTRSATARWATGCRAASGRSRPSCTLLAPVRPDAVHGRRVRRAGAFQFFTDHIDEEIAIATREGPPARSSPLSRRSPARRSPTRRPRLPSRVEVHARSNQALEPAPRAIAARRDLPTATRSSLGRRRALAAVRRGDRILIMNFHPERDLPIPAKHDVLVAAPSVTIAPPPLAGALVRA